jgi:hypothetical protein
VSDRHRRWIEQAWPAAETERAGTSSIRRTGHAHPAYPTTRDGPSPGEARCSFRLAKQRITDASISACSTGPSARHGRIPFPGSGARSRVGSMLSCRLIRLIARQISVAVRTTPSSVREAYKICRPVVRQGRLPSNATLRAGAGPWQLLCFACIGLRTAAGYCARIPSRAIRKTRSR